MSRWGTRSKGGKLCREWLVPSAHLLDRHGRFIQRSREQLVR